MARNHKKLVVSEVNLLCGRFELLICFRDMLLADSVGLVLLMFNEVSAMPWCHAVVHVEV